MSKDPETISGEPVGDSYYTLWAFNQIDGVFPVLVMQLGDTPIYLRGDGVSFELDVNLAKTQAEAIMHLCQDMRESLRRERARLDKLQATIERLIAVTQEETNGKVE